ncbi:MAG TPA: amidohydrolase family protein [Kineosporiaceae bacterium]|nr:amidohydrolase family protein [Kineosporiaceae bacterium]
MVQMSGEPLSTLRLRDWRPVAQVKAPSTTVSRPAVTCIDVHNHLGRWLSSDGDWLVKDVRELLDVMDTCGVETIVNLDGRWGEELTANLERYDRAHPGRFITFAHFDWTALALPEPDRVTSALLTQLDDAAARGARGLKVWKDLGLTHRDAAGELVLPDDDRLRPVFAAAGERGLPVLIHTADPLAFFSPLDGHNERIDELGEQPSWWFGGAGGPTFERLIAALEGLVAAAPGTTFIGAHVGCYAEDLAWVARMLTTYPHFAVDIGGRIGELGRVPRGFRRLVEAHPRQVLFGTDAYPPCAEAYRLAYRFLETDDEAFGYAPGCGGSTGEVPPQGRWDISAAALPAALLPQLYAGNARRLLNLP